MKFNNKPLIWKPSTSASVNNIIPPPYLKLSVLSYTLPCYKPNIFLILIISWFSDNYLGEASLTFNNLPFNGNTPYLSVPITLLPVIAVAMAESPSVNIK